MKSAQINPLFQSVRELIEKAQSHVVRNVNTVMIYTYFNIGKMIVTEQQKGNTRTGYAEEIIKDLSKSLTTEYGKGFSKRNLDYFKQFYLLYKDRIVQSLIAQSEPSVAVSQALISFSEMFKVSWTHYIQLMKIVKEEERDFYEMESAANNWSVRELQRQYNSSFFERLALSTNKKDVRALSEKGRLTETSINTLKNPVVLEFLGLSRASSGSTSATCSTPKALPAITNTTTNAIILLICCLNTSLLTRATGKFWRSLNGLGHIPAPCISSPVG